MFQRVCILKNPQHAGNNGIFKNVPALPFRIYTIYTHVPEFRTRQSIFKKDIHSESPGMIGHSLRLFVEKKKMKLLFIYLRKQ